MLRSSESCAGHTVTKWKSQDFHNCLSEVGKGREMTQTLHAHMNKRNKNKQTKKTKQQQKNHNCLSGSEAVFLQLTKLIPYNFIYFINGMGYLIKRT
jgi:hypothetical protein